MALNTWVRRSLVVGFAILVFSSVNLVTCARATNGGLNLPSTIVRMEVFNGTVTNFDIALSGVPSGYDVVNGTYPGWCVDLTANMAKSPAIHFVRLYSSIDPPGMLATERWDMVNYILNHKQGTREDIQQAIWYFINGVGNYTPSSTVANAIVSETLAHGNGFVPAYNQTIAVICFPVVLFPGSPEVQVSIIELSKPKVQGDVNFDNVVDIYDAILLANAFDSTPSSPDWNPNADLNGDRVVDILDAIILANNFN